MYIIITRKESKQMSRDHLLNSDDPKKVCWIPITTLEKKKVELVSRARILEPNVGAEREKERKKERRRKASIRPFYAGEIAFASHHRG